MVLLRDYLEESTTSRQPRHTREDEGEVSSYMVVLEDHVTPPSHHSKQQASLTQDVFFKIYFILNCMCVSVCLCMCMYTHTHVYIGTLRNQRCSSASGVTGYCRLSDMSAANQTCPLQELHVPSLQPGHKELSLCPHASIQFPSRCRPGASSNLVPIWPCLHGDSVRAWWNSSAPHAVL